jgi:C1A family cysteine protease
MTRELILLRIFCFLCIITMIILVCLWGNGNIGNNHSKKKITPNSSTESSHETNHTFLLNYKPSPPDPRDHELLLSVAKLPPSIDLSAKCSSIKNQGNFGACTAFAAVAHMEYLYKNYDPSVVKVEDMFSERFTYYTTRETMGVSPSEDSGAYIRDTIKTIVKKGSCLEATCPYLPYDQKTLTEKPSPAAYQEAMTYQVLSYANIPEDKNKLTTVKSALAALHPVECGFICYQNLFEGKGGNIPLPKGNVIGGHAILIVGYDDTKQVFKFKNSWSASWGDKGYGYLPYFYLTSGNMMDMWVIYSQESKNIAIGVNKPTVNIDKLKSDILTFVSTSDMKSFTKIQTDIESTIINITPGLTNSQILYLKTFTVKILNAIRS